jgi:hypothetical protein
VQAIGVTKGGRNTKIHAVVGELCHPLVFFLTLGNAADCVWQKPASASFSGLPSRKKTPEGDGGIIKRESPANSFAGNHRRYMAKQPRRPIITTLAIAERI